PPSAPPPPVRPLTPHLGTPRVSTRHLHTPRASGCRRRNTRPSRGPDAGPRRPRRTGSPGPEATRTGPRERGHEGARVTSDLVEDSGDPDVIFERHRRRLFGLAYRMLGQAQDAEDVTQDAYLRWAAAVRSLIVN